MKDSVIIGAIGTFLTAVALGLAGAFPQDAMIVGSVAAGSMAASTYLNQAGF